MIAKIETIAAKRLIGNSLIMSFSVNRTGELWRTFMPRRNEIANQTGPELYSLEVYPAGFFEPFNPDTGFEKWAAMEVTDFNSVPDGMEMLVVPDGLYAVFVHRGPASEGPKTYGFIFSQWLPDSGFELDFRPHFAVMGEKYKHEDPDSEEEIWIPVRIKE